MLQRDRPDTPFSRLLGDLAKAHPRLVIAAFVDEVGECIDYASRVPPYDAHVLGAQLADTTAELVRNHRAHELGALVSWSCCSDDKALFVQRVTEEHCLALMVAPPPLGAALMRALPALVTALRVEAGMEPASWEALGEPVSVETRSSTQWDSAPGSLLDAEGVRHQLEVLGRFHEGGGSWTRRAICYRVRSEGDELTLAHALHDGRWYKRC